MTSVCVLRECWGGDSVYDRLVSADRYPVALAMDQILEHVASCVDVDPCKIKKEHLLQDGQVGGDYV